MEDDLEQLLGESMEVAPPTAHPTWPSGAYRGITKVRYTHDAMIDLIISNPCISQNELAAQFGYSVSWISQVISSDAFQAKMAERTEELIDPVIKLSLEEKFRAMASRSMEILLEKLSKQTNLVPDNLVLRTLEVSTKALGFGASKESVAPPPVNMHIHLEQLGNNLTDLLQRKKREVIDIGEFDE